MEKTFETIRKENRLLYEYVRGSQAYGLAIETSDTDTAGVYLESIRTLLGTQPTSEEMIQDAKHDNVWYGLRRYMQLLCISNPNMIESLYIPERCVLYEHPIMRMLKEKRNMFLSKDLLKSLIGYSYTQIQKCRGLHKMFVNPVKERKSILDFCHVFQGQGSVKLTKWLEQHGLEQKYCGLVNIPNMHNMYGCYYDWRRFIDDNGINLSLVYWLYIDGHSQISEEMVTDAYRRLNDENISDHDKNVATTLIENHKKRQCFNFLKELLAPTGLAVTEYLESKKAQGYHGLIDEDGTSMQLRLSSVEKGERPICYISFNSEGFSKHCKDYKNYQEWAANRNENRYLENKGKTFDRKNVAHAVRLLHMGLEIAQGKGFNVDRTNIDRDFILNIRLGNTEYDEIISYIESKKNEMEDALAKTNLPQHVDIAKANDLLFSMQRELYCELI